MATVYKNQSPAMSAVKLLDRMKLAAAVKMADQYAERADADTTPRKHWMEVVDLLNSNARDVRPIYAQAKDDADGLPKKAAKPVATQTPTATPEPSTEAQPSAPATRLSESGKGADWAKEQTDKVASVAKSLKRKVEQAQQAIEVFKADFAKDPVYALEWSRPTFESAAQLRVFTLSWKRLTDESGEPMLYRKECDGLNLDNLRDYAQDQVNTRSRNASQERSTSMPSNMMEREYLAAWSEVLEIIRWNA